MAYICISIANYMFDCSHIVTYCYGIYAGKIILEAVILTAVVVASLTLFTFWAAKRGYDFNFLGPFLFGAVMVLVVFSFIQVCWITLKLSPRILEVATLVGYWVGD